MRYLVAALAALCCACASGPSFPYRACLADVGDRGTFLTGTVVMERADGALLFRADDSAWGDHGVYWFDSSNPGGKRLGPCLDDATSRLYPKGDTP